MINKPQRVVFLAFIAERRFEVRLELDNPEPCFGIRPNDRVQFAMRLFALVIDVEHRHEVDAESFEQLDKDRKVALAPHLEYHVIVVEPSMLLEGSIDEQLVIRALSQEHLTGEQRLNEGPAVPFGDTILKRIAAHIVALEFVLHGADVYLR